MTPEGFFTLAEHLSLRRVTPEILFCRVRVEHSDFVRLNHNRIRQAGQVISCTLDITLMSGARQASGSCELPGQPEQNLAAGTLLLERLRECLPFLPDDPYLHFSTEASTSHTLRSADLPPPETALAELMAHANGMDLVGIWSSGSIAFGMASSLGHRHWHETESFHLDWSCYLDADKAVKSSLGGDTWKREDLLQELTRQREHLEILQRPVRTLKPGQYRAYLAPAAVQEWIELLSWGGFDTKSHQTLQTPLLHLAQGNRHLHPSITLKEEIHRGLQPTFTDEGFLVPSEITLIQEGQFRDCLCDARAAREYGEEVNSAQDSPTSIALSAGDLPGSETVAALDTGLWISNLWYCNWSDRNECRLTGMTRFATFWVEKGQIQGPVSVMRFDDSLYPLLGERLEGVTRERQLLLSTNTYEGRSTDSALLPGLLVSGLNLTL